MRIVQKNVFKQEDPSVEVTHLRTLRGHRSYIKHMDWGKKPTDPFYVSATTAITACSRACLPNT